MSHCAQRIVDRSRLFSTIVALVTAAWLGTPLAAADAVDVDLVLSTPDRIVLEYTINDYQLEPEKAAGPGYVEPILAGEASRLEAGVPALPYVCRSVIIPDDAEMAVNVLNAEYEDVPALVVPSKGNLLRTVDPDTVPFRFGEVYRQDAFYPGSLAHLREPYVLRDYRGVTVVLEPLQYNPVQGVLRVYHSVTLEIVRTGESKTNVFQPTLVDRPLVQAYDDLYAHHFVNYARPLTYTPLNEQGEMLIIVHDAWYDNILPLASHKNAIGIPTTVVRVSEIPGGNTATAIKNYIQSVYDSSNLVFVLLVGDSAEVATPSAWGGAADPTYGKVAGADDYPDIMIGRFSAQSAAHVDTQVSRTIEYETSQMTQQAWFKQATGIASAEGGGYIGDEGESDAQHMDNIRTDLLVDGYTTVDRIYDPGATDSQVATAVNAGRGIINYVGHGSTTSWGTTYFNNTDVDALTNTGKLPIIISVACVNGNFNGSTCFGEAWLRATHNGAPSGAAAAYMSSINQSWDPPMAGQDHAVDLFVAESYVTFGGICFAGSCGMIDKYGNAGVEIFDTWHIFGDPSLRVVGVAQPPSGLSVTPLSAWNASGAVGGPFTPVQRTYTLENHDPAPMDYEVTTDRPWVTITDAAGTISAGGTADVTVTINALAETLGNGTHAATLSFVNVSNHDGDRTSDIALTIGSPSLQYEWTMDSNPGWAAEGDWEFGAPQGLGGTNYGYPDPTSGHTGSYVYGYNLSGDYPAYLSPAEHLTTTAIDCAGLSETELRFWRWLGVERSRYDHASISVQGDDGVWTQIWANPDSETADNAWVQQTFDISAIADGQSSVKIRWTMGTSDASWQYCGWNIDDVQIWGLAAGGPDYVAGDMNCDNVIDVFDIDPFVQALLDPAGYPADYPGCLLEQGDINRDGAVDVFDIDPFVQMLLENE